MSIKAVEKQQIMQIKLAFHHENVKNAPIEEQGYRNVRSLVCDSAKRAALLRKSGAVILPKTCLRGESVALRTQKRWILVDEVGDNAAKLQTDQIRYVRLNDEYVRFSKAAGLRTQVERAEVSGFGPKQEMSAAGENKVVEKLANSMYSGDTESNVSEYIRDRNAYISKYPISDSRYFNAYKELKNLGIKKGVLLPAVQKQAFILPSGKHDPNHVLKRMLERNITDDEVRSYMANARAMFAQWGGARQAFYGTDGVSVIAKDDGNWLYKTVWRKEDFDEETDLILEVLSKYGL